MNEGLIRSISRINMAPTVTHRVEKGQMSKKYVECIGLLHQLVKTRVEGRVKLTPRKQYVVEETDALDDVAACISTACVEGGRGRSARRASPLTWKPYIPVTGASDPLADDLASVRGLPAR
jgi:hypothetical protein